METATVVTPEQDPVISWRINQLVLAGYPELLAFNLASAHDVDLHKACQMIEAGCDPEVAAEILL